MTRKTLIVALLGFVPVLPANAATIAFSGSQHNFTAPPMPTAKCGLPQVEVSFGAAEMSYGTSNLGSFVANESHCIVLPPPAAYSDGEFSFDFAAGDSLLGTYFGNLTESGTPGLLSNMQEFTVTGGTGRFFGASGSFTGLGTLDLRPDANLYAEINFSGLLDAPGVPEPATWTLLILGFGLIGRALRGRRPALVLA